MDAPAGLPLVQHALLTLLEQVHLNAMTLTKVVEKISHNPAKRYKIANRGFIREGYFADLVLVDPNTPTKVTHDNSHYLCKWTPFNSTTFNNKIAATFVNGEQVYNGEEIIEQNTAMPLLFNRD